jgi:predicted 3-demethylubiquinone-9 3-methyltransferase (glyoxalase superfamily)
VLKGAKMQKIIPSLWFDNNCEEAMGFYTSTFPNSKIVSIKRYEKGMQTPGIDQMVGKVLTGIFELDGFRFMALDGGPIFKFNPSVSFILNFDPAKDQNASDNIEKFWKKISADGKVLMEFQKYPFSEKYGWCEDKFGVSWQLMLTNPEGEERPFITPSLMFVKQRSGKAKEAREFYLSVFKNSRPGAIVYFEENTQFNQKKGDVMFSDFMIEDTWLAAMDGGDPHNFDFNEAVSFLVNCKGQQEVDYYWQKLSAVAESEVCGWLKDTYGVSWQIIPQRMENYYQIRIKKNHIES